MKSNSLLISVLAALAVLLCPSGALAQKNPLRDKGGAPKITPDIANEHYGPHERNVLDLWKAKSDKPTPLVVYIHGGGYRAGSKESVNPALVSALLAKGPRPLR